MSAVIAMFSDLPRPVVFRLSGALVHRASVALCIFGVFMAEADWSTDVCVALFVHVVVTFLAWG